MRHVLLYLITYLRHWADFNQYWDFDLWWDRPGRLSKSTEAFLAGHLPVLPVAIGVCDVYTASVTLWQWCTSSDYLIRTDSTALDQTCIWWKQILLYRVIAKEIFISVSVATLIRTKTKFGLAESVKLVSYNCDLHTASVTLWAMVHNIWFSDKYSFYCTWSNMYLMRTDTAIQDHSQGVLRVRISRHTDKNKY